MPNGELNGFLVLVVSNFQRILRSSNTANRETTTSPDICWTKTTKKKCGNYSYAFSTIRKRRCLRRIPSTSRKQTSMKDTLWETHWQSVPRSFRGGLGAAKWRFSGSRLVFNVTFSFFPLQQSPRNFRWHLRQRQLKKEKISIIKINKNK